MTYFSKTLLLGAFAVLAASAARAQSLTLDDFTTGPTAISLSSGIKTTYQTGSHIVGNVRATTFGFYNAGANVFGQVAAIRIHKATGSAPAALAFGEGFQSYARLDMFYGNEANGPPLHLDVSAYDRFRVHYYGINGIVNFNIQAFTGSAYSQWGCNILPTFGPTTVDLPFANAVVGGAVFTSLDGFDFIFQSQGEGIDFGITQVEFVPAGTPPGDLTCPPIGGSRHRA